MTDQLNIAQNFNSYFNEMRSKLTSEILNSGNTFKQIENNQ